jgi:Protein of unknown function (DUF2408)
MLKGQTTAILSIQEVRNWPGVTKCLISSGDVSCGLKSFSSGKPSLKQRLPTTSLYLLNHIRKGEILEPFRETYATLVGIRNELEKFSLTQAWSLRETDLYDFQCQLDKIDESRINGNFCDRDGNPAELYVQRVVFPKLYP